MPLPYPLMWLTVRLLRPPSLPRANERGAVRPTTRPRMSASANAMKLSSSRHRATRRPARDVSRASRVRGGSPPCDTGQRGGRHVAYKAVYPQGRTQGAGGGVGSDVVEVRLAFHPTALPAPSFGSLVHPSPMARGVMWKPAPGGMWEPKRLTAVVHRRAEFLRPSPSVPIRGLRCGGRVAVAVLFAL